VRFYHSQASQVDLASSSFSPSGEKSEPIVTSRSDKQKDILSFYPSFIDDRVQVLPEVANAIRKAKYVQVVESLEEDYPYPVSIEQQKEQLLCEIEAVERAAQKFKKQVDTVIELNRGACLSPGNELTVQWFCQLRERISHFLKTITPAVKSMTSSSSTSSSESSSTSLDLNSFLSESTSLSLSFSVSFSLSLSLSLSHSLKLFVFFFFVCSHSRR
jgi:hypothetical protein